MNSSADFGWVAGWFDSSGSIMIAKNGRGERIDIVLTKYDKRPLQRVRDLTGVGHIYFRKTAGRGQWAWTVSRQEEVVRFIDTILPFTMVKKHELFLARAVAVETGRPKESLVRRYAALSALLKYQNSTPHRGNRKRKPWIQRNGLQKISSRSSTANARVG